jgi:hypothetical protein
MVATSNVDYPAVEHPIYIESISSHREHTFRAYGAEYLNLIPIDPDLVWNQVSLIPPDRPPDHLAVNAGAGAGVVELVAMVLAPVAGSKLKWEFASWAGAGPPAVPNVSTPLSRVIPATFGNEESGLGGAYRPTLTGAPTYDGHSWVVDGLNHYVEFPYGPPPGLPAAPVLTFYRYTGITGGSDTPGPSGDAGYDGWPFVGEAGPEGPAGPAGPGGAAGTEGGAGPEGPPGALTPGLAFNWAPGGNNITETLNAASPNQVIGGNIYSNYPNHIISGIATSYYPQDRFIPIQSLNAVNVLEFEASGKLTPKNGSGYLTLKFGILVGYNTNGVLGLTPCTFSFDNTDKEFTWTYKMLASKDVSYIGAGFKMVSTSHVTVTREADTEGAAAITSQGYTVGAINYLSSNLNMVPTAPTVDDGSTACAVYISADSSTGVTGSRSVDVTKYYHLFRYAVI